MFLSIIVPVYNVERYLSQCLDSILRCELEDAEILLINDGSTDRSSKICVEYAEKNNCISVINQNNSGLSCARNTGMRASKGDYLLFLDSDDLVVHNKLCKCIDYVLKSQKRGVDLIVNDFYRCNEEGTIFEETTQIKGINGDGYFSEFASAKGSYWNVWRTIYRRQFLLKNDLWFEEGFLCEDVDFTTRAFLSGGKMEFIHEPYYCYRMGRQDSIMSNVSFQRVYSIITIISDLIPHLDNAVQQPAFSSIRNHLGLEYLFSFTSVYEVQSKDRKRTVNLLKEHLGVLKTCSGKTAILYKLSLCFGVRLVALGLLIAKKVRRIAKSCKIK